LVGILIRHQVLGGEGVRWASREPKTKLKRKFKQGVVLRRNGASCSGLPS
jgi:hypothetical protein